MTTRIIHIIIHPRNINIIKSKYFILSNIKISYSIKNNNNYNFISYTYIPFIWMTIVFNLLITKWTQFNDWFGTLN